MKKEELLYLQWKANMDKITYDGKLETHNHDLEFVKAYISLNWILPQLEESYVLTIFSEQQLIKFQVLIKIQALKYHNSRVKINLLDFLKNVSNQLQEEKLIKKIPYNNKIIWISFYESKQPNASFKFYLRLSALVVLAPWFSQLGKIKFFESQQKELKERYGINDCGFDYKIDYLLYGREEERNLTIPVIKNDHDDIIIPFPTRDALHIFQKPLQRYLPLEVDTEKMLGSFLFWLKINNCYINILKHGTKVTTTNCQVKNLSLKENNLFTFFPVAIVDIIDEYAVHHCASTDEPCNLNKTCCIM